MDPVHKLSSPRLVEYAFAPIPFRNSAPFCGTFRDFWHKCGTMYRIFPLFSVFITPCSNSTCNFPSRKVPGFSPLLLPHQNTLSGNAKNSLGTDDQQDNPSMWPKEPIAVVMYEMIGYFRYPYLRLPCDTLNILAEFREIWKGTYKNNSHRTLRK